MATTEPREPTVNRPRESRVSHRLTNEQVWRAIDKASFAVLGYVTPRGEPRSSGVVYKMIDRRLYVAVAPDSWKARHIAAPGAVAVTVTVRPRRRPVAHLPDSAGHRQLPRAGERIPGEVAGGPLAEPTAGRDAPRGAPRIGLPDRDRSRG